jgi:hypothetical protein
MPDAEAPAAEAPAPDLPAARQCTDPDDPLFGAVAVASAIPGVAWSVMTPANGGHHVGSDTEVADWAELKSATPAKRKPKPAPPTAPEPEPVPEAK